MRPSLPPLLLLHCLWLAFGLALPAHAQSDTAEPAEELKTGPLALDQAPGLLLVLTALPEDLGEGAPTGWATLDDTTVEGVFVDDGKAPDGTAGDHTWVLLLADHPTGDAVEVGVADGAGTELWVDAVAISTSIDQPRVELVQLDERMKVSLTTFGAGIPDGPELVAGQGPSVSDPPEPDGPDLTTPEGRANADRPPRPEPGTEGTEPRPEPGEDGTHPPPPSSLGSHQDGLAGGTATTLVLAGLMGLMGLAAGLAFGLLMGRRGRDLAEAVPLNPPSEPADWPGMPAVRQHSQAWVASDADTRAHAVERLLAHMAPAGPVVLAPHPDRLDALRTLAAAWPMVCTVDADDPTPQELVKTAERVACLGRPLILVDGLAALEAAEKGESAADPALELIEIATQDVDVLVVTERSGAADLRPSATVARDEAGDLVWVRFAAPDRRIDDGEGDEL